MDPFPRQPNPVPLFPRVGDMTPPCEQCQDMVQGICSRCGRTNVLPNPRLLFGTIGREDGT